MAEVLLFHHAQGLTEGVLAFAEELRDAGHKVHTPDLYNGHTFHSLDDGLAYAREVGFGNLLDQGVQSADRLADSLVYVGFSLGVMPAQKLAQTRPGARGALLLCGAVPPDEFGTTWPNDLPVQIHGMDADPYFAGEDLDAARTIVSEAKHGELFIYPGDQHLFADSSLSSYDADATALLTERVIAFLGEL